MSNILVIGGGVIGLMSAWRLAQAGKSVILYEKDVCGAGATGHAIGGLIPFSYSRNHDLAVTQRESLAMYPQVAAELQQEAGVDVGFKLCHRIQIFGTPGQRESGARDAELTQGIQRIIGAQELKELAPAVQPGELDALYCSATARVQPKAFVAALKQACKNAGVNIQENTPVYDLQDVYDVADQILVTAGAWTTQLLPDFHVRPVKGQALRVKLPKMMFTQMVRQGEVYMVPYDDGTVVIGSTSEPNAGFDVTPSGEARATLLETAIKLVPALEEAEVQSHWAGLRPLSEKGEPLVRRLDERTVVAAGHYKIGLCLAPKVAEKVLEQF